MFNQIPMKCAISIHIYWIIILFLYPIEQFDCQLSIHHSNNVSLINQANLIKNNGSETRMESNVSALNAGQRAKRLSSRILLLMKLLQLIQQQQQQKNGSLYKNRTNYMNQTSLDVNGTSESRSLSSWLQLRGKLNQRQEIPFGSGPSELIIKGNGFPIPQRSPSQFSLFPTQKHQSLQQSQPTSFPISNKLNDPLFYVPTLSDTSGIDYWLKFIEQANLDEPSIPLIEKSKNNFDNSNNLKSSTLYRRVKGNRNRNRSRGHSISRYKSRPKIMKLRPDGSKYQENDYDTEPDLLSDYSGKLKSSKPVEYDSSPRCDKFTDEICIDDFEYPENAILDEIFKRKDIFQLMYSEVKGDQPMVDGMERDEEESFSQDYYYNNNEPDTDDYGDGEQPSYPYNRTEYQNDLMDNDNDNRNQQTSSSEKNQKVTGFVCRSEVLYAKPKLARNIKGKWRVIVNAGDFTQTLRLEKCTKANSECRFISDHKYGSRCAQINAIHRLLVFEKGKGKLISSSIISINKLLNLNRILYRYIPRSNCMYVSCSFNQTTIRSRFEYGRFNQQYKT